MKSTFRTDLPIPDTVWNIFIFVIISHIFHYLFGLFSSHDEHNAMKWLYFFYIAASSALCVYAWRKRNEDISQKYKGFDSMNPEEKNGLVEEQTDYFRYQYRVALLIGFWGTLVPILMFYFFNAVDLPSIAVALTNPFLFISCWSLVIWRAVMSIYYLRKLKQTQQPV